jgi:phytoene/squalene synthetase
MMLCRRRTQLWLNLAQRIAATNYQPYTRTRIFSSSSSSTSSTSSSSSSSGKSSVNGTHSHGATSNKRYDERWLINQAMTTVQQYDPGAYMPGHLLLSDSKKLRTSYFAIRAFWIETGLRHGSTAYVAPNATPKQHIQWWNDALHHTLYQGITSDIAGGDDADVLRSYESHPLLQLLLLLQEKYHIQWKQEHFDEVLSGRFKDVDVKQYATMQDLIQHAEQSCGSLTKLVLQSAHIEEQTNPYAHEAARKIGISHGLCNALRQSVAVLSTAGKLIIPAELTTRYNVKSPRYLLSALGMGDEQCERALQSCVQDIVVCAQQHLAEARTLRDSIQREPNGNVAIQCLLLSTMSTEMFLHRLRQYEYKLTDRNLRYTNFMDQSRIAVNILSSYYQSKY